MCIHDFFSFALNKLGGFWVVSDYVFEIMYRLTMYAQRLLLYIRRKRFRLVPCRQTRLSSLKSNWSLHRQRNTFVADNWSALSFVLIWLADSRRDDCGLRSSWNCWFLADWDAVCVEEQRWLLPSFGALCLHGGHLGTVLRVPQWVYIIYDNSPSNQTIFTGFARYKRQNDR